MIFGIRIEKNESRKFTLTQIGLIAKVLKESNILSCDNANTSSFITPSGTNVDGESFNELWNYTTVVGMLVYLSKNSRPGITYAVN